MNVLSSFKPGDRVSIRDNGIDVTVVEPTVVITLNGKIFRDPAKNARLVESLMPTLKEHNIEMGQTVRGDNGVNIAMYKGYVINVNSVNQVYADYELVSIKTITVRFEPEQHAMLRDAASRSGLNVVTGLQGGRTHLKHKRSHTKHSNAKRNKRVSKKNQDIQKKSGKSYRMQMTK
jgi:hypothetical protein